jgi:hypothetical protein
MKTGILHAKRISHSMSEVLVELDGWRSSIAVVDTAGLLIAAARYSTEASFDSFYRDLAIMGTYASLTAARMDEILAELSIGAWEA